MKALVWTGVVATLLVAGMLALFLFATLPDLLPPGSAVVIDGERHDIGNIAQAMAEHWPLVALLVLIAAVVIVVVVPLVLVLAIGVPLLTGALGLAFSVLATALVLSPLLLLGWWLWQRWTARKATTIAA